MDHQSGDSGSQLVLDNRKLIIAFTLLILICGTFFVIGFMEGKRQGLQRASEKVPERAAAVADSGTGQAAAKTATTQPGPDAQGDKAVRENLDWYSSVNRRGDEAVKGLEAPKKGSSAPAVDKTVPSSPAAARDSKTREPKPPAQVQAGKVTYSVQVGAFRQRKEAEAKASLLKSRRYIYAIEPSGEPDKLFLLKVGKYESRAEAVAMQNRLKKDGFKTFIKTNQ